MFEGIGETVEEKVLWKEICGLTSDLTPDPLELTATLLVLHLLSINLLNFYPASPAHEPILALGYDN